ncbi:hypothetical protein Rhe02_20230 [Rhizocola hellebori]|uniref:Uncharacterized protein n=2 Tax=Rhizocola hellebori TaxID=1392758 RepID=A0A8J3VF70_9ACTN|nr:hypothetical protein Rhe02_20230 [Rhizocola hellebori]
MTAVIVLTPLAAWAFAAPGPTGGWWVSGLLVALLVTCMWLSRVVFSQGPVASPIDWLLPYTAGAIVICVVAMVAARRWRLGPAVALAVVTLVVSGLATLTIAMEGEGVYIPANDAALLSAGVSVVEAGEPSCGVDGATCVREVTLRTDRTAAELREMLRSRGWAEQCQPVTGILSHLSLSEYGERCLTLGDLEPGMVVVSVEAEAQWKVRARP